MDSKSSTQYAYHLCSSSSSSLRHTPKKRVVVNQITLSVYHNTAQDYKMVREFRWPRFLTDTSSDEDKVRRYEYKIQSQRITAMLSITNLSFFRSAHAHAGIIKKAPLVSRSRRGDLKRPLTCAIVDRNFLPSSHLYRHLWIMMGECKELEEE
jgi:hypothetical protein